LVCRGGATLSQDRDTFGAVVGMTLLQDHNALHQQLFSRETQNLARLSLNGVSKFV
jgi:hypothetical protein